MIALAGLLVLVAGALLVGGLGNGDSTLLWASVGVSVLAAVVLVLQTVRRRRSAPAGDDEAAPGAESADRGDDGAPASGPRTGGDDVHPAPASTTSGAPTSEPTTATQAASGSAVGTGSRSPDEDAAAEGPLPVVPGPSTGSHAARPVADAAAGGEPVEEIVEVTDLLLVLDLTDEVVVVDEHPRYHLAGCTQTAGQEEIGLPLTEAREDGFTACGVCRPDRHLADAERTRRAAAR